MQLRKVLRDSMGFAASQYAVRLALLARGIIAARWLGPHAYGAWNALVLLLEYGMLAHFGTLQGLDQAVPARIAEGDPKRLDRVKRVGLGNILLLTGLFTALCLAYFARTEGQLRNSWGFSGIALILGCAMLTSMAYYHLTLLRSHGDITAVSAWFIVQAGVGALLGVALIPSLGVWGLLWGWFAGTAVAAFLVRGRAQGRVPLVPAIGRDSIALLAVGLPMFLYAGSNLLMRTLDRVIILRFLGTEPLGFYSLSVLLLGLLLYLPDSVGYVLYPRLVQRFRETDHDLESIRGAVERPLRAISLVVPGLCGAASLAAPAAVMLLLPRFEPAIAPMRAACFGAAGVALANLAAIVLMTLGRHLLLVPAALAFTALGATLALAAVRLGYGITGVAWASFFSFLVNGLVLTFAVQGVLASGRASTALRQTLRLFLPVGVALALTAGVDLLFASPAPEDRLGTLGRALATVVTFGVLYAAAILPLARGVGFLSLLREFVWPRLPGRARPSVEAEE